LYKLIFYVPIDACEIVKSAIFATGAGTLGNYSNCCWQVLGEAKFIPTGNANPYIGIANEPETVAEYRVEILCTELDIELAVAALLNTHPYEKPAFEVYHPEEKYFSLYTQAL